MWGIYYIIAFVIKMKTFALKWSQSRIEKPSETDSIKSQISSKTFHRFTEADGMANSVGPEKTASFRVLLCELFVLGMHCL